MASKVIVCCKLPNGIILEHPTRQGVKVELAGLNKALIKGAPAQTEVDAEFWTAWREGSKESRLLSSGAVFEARTSDEARGKAREFEDRKTGLEPMSRNVMGVMPSVEG